MFKYFVPVTRIVILEIEFNIFLYLYIINNINNKITYFIGVYSEHVDVYISYQAFLGQKSS